MPSVIEIDPWRRVRLSCVLAHNVVIPDASWTKMACVSLCAAVFWDFLQAHMFVVPLTCPTWFLALCLSCDAEITTANQLATMIPFGMYLALFATAAATFFIDNQLAMVT